MTSPATKPEHPQLSCKRAPGSIASIPQRVPAVAAGAVVAAAAAAILVVVEVEAGVVILEFGAVLANLVGGVGAEVAFRLLLRPGRSHHQLRPDERRRHRNRALDFMSLHCTLPC